MKKVLTIILAVLCLANFANATISYWGGNGHGYEVITNGGNTGITFFEAKQAAEDAGGYLATVTSSDENAFITDLLSVPPYNDNWGWWLGGSGYLAGTWEWITGPETGDAFTYTNWRDVEPNHDNTTDPDPFYLQIRWTADNLGTSGHGQWADRANSQVLSPPDDIYDAKSVGYVIEYVPEPATLALLGLGGLLLRKRK